MHVVFEIKSPVPGLNLIDYSLIRTVDAEGEWDTDSNGNPLYQLWALWNNSLQYCMFSLNEQGLYWIPCFFPTPDPIEVPMDASESAYLSLLFGSHSEYPLALIALASEYPYDYSSNACVGALQEHTRKYVASQCGDLAHDIASANLELNATWYRFLIKLASLYEDSLICTGLYCDSKIVNVITKGGSLGFLSALVMIGSL
jgi:hypothetical protein